VLLNRPAGYLSVLSYDLLNAVIDCIKAGRGLTSALDAFLRAQFARFHLPAGSCAPSRLLQLQPQKHEIIFKRRMRFIPIA